MLFPGLLPASYRIGMGLNNNRKYLVQLVIQQFDNTRKDKRPFVFPLCHPQGLKAFPLGEFLEHFNS